MAGILFDTYSCLDVIQERQNLAELGFPVPPEMDRASVLLNVLGQQPSKGWVILPRSTVNTINHNATHTVTFFDDAGNTLKLYNLYFVKAQNLTPGTLGDADAAYLVEVADYRHLLSDPFLGIPINAQYNVRAPAFGGSYYAGSLNAGSAWTWQTMFTNIWNLMPGLGTAPTLPYTPDGTPEGWRFVGITAWQALSEILWRIGCAVKCDLSVSSGQYSVVRIGTTDTTSDNLITQALPKKLYDSEWIEGVKARNPASVRVHFNVQYSDYGSEQTTPQTSTQWATSPIYTVNVAGPDSTANLDANIIHPLWDDLPALADASGSITNSSALNTRASERSNTFYSMLRSPGGNRKRQIFSGVVKIQPGSTLRGVAWRQDQHGLGGEDPGGIVTEIVNHPFWMLGVDDCCGRFMEVPWSPSSTQNRAPDFNPTWPIYPHIYQKVRITTGSADANGLFTGFVQQYNPVARTWADKEACYAKEHNGQTTLTSNERHNARLSGYDSTGAPIYTIDGCCSMQKSVSTASLAGGTSNNLAIPATQAWYASPSSSATITGMTEAGGSTPQDGRRFFFKNDTAIGSGFTITFPNQSASSSLANRVVTADGNSIILQPQEGYWIEYKASNQGGSGGWVFESYSKSTTATSTIQYISGSPGSPVNGQIWINSTGCLLQYQCGGSTYTVITAGAGGSGTQYQTAVWSGTNSLTGVAVGTSGQVLTSNGAGAYPTYQTISASGIGAAGTSSGSATGTTTNSDTTIFDVTGATYVNGAYSFDNTGGTGNNLTSKVTSTGTNSVTALSTQTFTTALAYSQTTPQQSYTGVGGDTNIVLPVKEILGKYGADGGNSTTYKVVWGFTTG